MAAGLSEPGADLTAGVWGLGGSGRSSRPLVLSALFMGLEKGCLHLWVWKPPPHARGKWQGCLPLPRDQNTTQTDLWQQACVDTDVRSQFTETLNQATNTDTGRGL